MRVLLVLLLAALPVAAAVPLARTYDADERTTTYEGIAFPGSRDDAQDWRPLAIVCTGALQDYEYTLVVDGTLGQATLLLDIEDAPGTLSAYAKPGEPATLAGTSADGCATFAVTGVTVATAAPYRVLVRIPEAVTAPK